MNVRYLSKTAALLAVLPLALTWAQKPAYQRTWLAGAPDQVLGEYSCSENNVDRDHLGPGPIRPDGSRGYDDLAPLPPQPGPIKKQ
jgi:hypothetical protein